MSATTKAIRFIGFDLSAQSGLKSGAQRYVNNQDMLMTARTSVKLRPLPTEVSPKLPPPNIPRKTPGVGQRCEKTSLILDFLA
jgi:hypothetical protein